MKIGRKNAKLTTQKKPRNFTHPQQHKVKQLSKRREKKYIFMFAYRIESIALSSDMRVHRAIRVEASSQRHRNST
jgi:hypothetical protein